MSYYYATRVLSMVAAGTTPKEAIAWVTRKLPKGLKFYYEWQVWLIVANELGYNR